MSRALATKGVIIGFLEAPQGQQPQPEQSGFPLVIQFVDERTGEEYTLVTKPGLHPIHYAYRPSPPIIGREVDVLYDPEDPNNARINSFLDIWLGPIAVTGLGGILSSAGLILTIRRQRLESSQESS